MIPCKFTGTGVVSSVVVTVENNQVYQYQVYQVLLNLQDMPVPALLSWFYWTILLAFSMITRAKYCQGKVSPVGPTLNHAQSRAFLYAYNLSY